MIKFFERYKKLKEIRLKHERLQCYIGKLLKINSGIDLYKLETDIMTDRVLEYNDQKRLNRLCGLKRSEIYYIRSKKEDSDGK